MTLSCDGSGHDGKVPLAGVVKTLAGELGPAGIRVNALLPVRIATDRVRELDALQGDPDEVRPAV